MLSPSSSISFFSFLTIMCTLPLSLQFYINYFQSDPKLNGHGEEAIFYELYLSVFLRAPSLLIFLVLGLPKVQLLQSSKQLPYTTKYSYAMKFVPKPVPSLPIHIRPQHRSYIDKSTCCCCLLQEGYQMCAHTQR